jgi:hypothetical protein
MTRTIPFTTLEILIISMTLMSRTSGLFNGLPRVCQIPDKLRSDILRE